VPVFTVPLHEKNDCHNPPGTPVGGRFCSMTMQAGGSGLWAMARRSPVTSRRAIRSEMRPATDAERRRLAIPPAYTDAMVAVDPKAELRATAKTPVGKTASYYSAAYTERQDAAKWSRVMALQRAMPSLVTRIDRDSQRPRGTDYPKAMALRLIALTGMRNGGEPKGQKESFGATSLLTDHVSVAGDTVRMVFPGKSGVAQDITVADGPLANYVRERQATGARTLFPHKSGETLDYLRKISGGKFKVHDLRTWNGTVMADRLVDDIVKAGLTPKTQKQLKALRKQVATAVSKRLGNTPAMALSTYIHPAVFRPLEVSL
jgi:DNA topoisomerase-1